MISLFYLVTVEVTVMQKMIMAVSATNQVPLTQNLTFMVTLWISTMNHAM